MSTVTLTPSGAARPKPGSPAAWAAAAIIRGIGRRTLRRGRTPHFACGACLVTWSGPEADCFSCGQPATTEYTHRGAALQMLLQHVRPAAVGKEAAS